MFCRSHSPSNRGTHRTDAQGPFLSQSLSYTPMISYGLNWTTSDDSEDGFDRRATKLSVDSLTTAQANRSAQATAFLVADEAIMELTNRPTKIVRNKQYSYGFVIFSLGLSISRTCYANDFKNSSVVVQFSAQRIRYGRVGCLVESPKIRTHISRTRKCCESTAAATITPTQELNPP